MAEPKIVISAKDKTKTAFESVNRRMKDAADAATGLTGKLAALAGVGGMEELIRQSMESADQLAKMSDRLGLSTQSLAAFRLEGKLAGSDAQTTTDAIEKMTKNIGDAAQGFGQASTLLRAMNINIVELAKMTPEEQYKKISDAIMGLDSASKQVSATMAIFGRSGMSVLNMIKEGSKGFEEAKRQAEQYGTAISRIDAAKIEAANDAMTRAGEAVSGLGTKIAVQLAPYIEAATKEFTHMASTGEISGKHIFDVMQEVAEGIGKVGDTVRIVEFGWEKLELGAELAAQGILDAFQKVEVEIAKIVNEIPGIHMKPDDSIHQWALKAGAAAANTYDQLDKLVKEPMPSTKIKAVFETIRSEADKAAEAIAHLHAAQMPHGKKHQSMADIMGNSMKLSLQKQYDQLDKSYKAQENLLRISYEKRKQIIMRAQRDGLISEARAEDVLYKQKRKFEDDTISLKLRSATAQIAIGSTMFEQLTQGVATKSRVMFEINKVASLANAAVKGAEAVVNAYAFGSSWGGPFGGAAMAAIAAIAVGAQIRTIASTQYGGGAAISASGGVGAGVPSLATAAGVPTASQNQPATNTPAHNVHVQLVVDPHGVADPNAMRNFVVQLKQTISDMGSSGSMAA